VHFCIWQVLVPWLTVRFRSDRALEKGSEILLLHPLPSLERTSACRRSTAANCPFATIRLRYAGISEPRRSANKAISRIRSLLDEMGKRYTVAFLADDKSESHKAGHRSMIPL
jgi:hypothetical protein